MTAARQLILVFGIALALVGLPAAAWCACRPVADAEQFRLSQENMDALAQIGFDRKAFFLALETVSMPETRGCWSGATGNFDSQIVSVGVLQWNYGQGTLQRMFKHFRAKYDSAEAFEAEKLTLMPATGDIFFSSGCLQAKITAECRSKVLALQDAGGRLNDTAKAELDAMFSSDAMVQLQIDHYATLVTSVTSDLNRRFGSARPSPLKVKWAIDTKVQQGHFPANDVVARSRKNAATLSVDNKRARLLSLVTWYEGHCGAIDSDGVRLDYQYNVQVWRERIGELAEGPELDEAFDLLNLTYLRSRLADGEGGRWQALTFQRRATIVLRVGSVAGRRVDLREIKA